MKILVRKKIWNGLISLRDYEVNAAIKDNGCIVEFNGKRMTLSKQQLQKGFQTNTKKQISKYGTEPYTLIDFKWVPDEENSKQLELFRKEDTWKT